MTAPDDEAKPMTRTELAMLWDLLGRWQSSHDRPAYDIPPLLLHEAAPYLRASIDRELTTRYGG